MEWVRSTYRSKWRLFRDQPGIDTPGRFVFAPEGTAHLDTLHNLWHRGWVSDELDPYPALGPSPNAAMVPDKRDPGLPYPPARLLGSAECLQRGETWPLPVVERTLHNGWDSRCYLTPQPTGPSTDVQDCHFQEWMARLLELSYDPDDDRVLAHVLGRYPGAVVTFVPNTDSSFPGSVIVQTGQTYIIAVSGTQNSTQWVLQVLGSVNGPVVYDGYGTIPLWREASDVMVERLEAAGFTGAGPVVCAGHSYGGAVASILAARFKRAQPNRSVSLMTEGCPRIGDQALIDLITPVNSINFVNVDDVVSIIPPRGDELGGLSWLLTAQQFGAWNRWRALPNRVQLSPQGERLGPPGNPSGYRLLLQLVASWLDGVPVEVSSAHFYQEYARRIRCPLVPVPAPDPGIVPSLWLKPDNLPPSEAPSAIVAWLDASPYARRVEQFFMANQPVVRETAPAMRAAAFTFDTYLGTDTFFLPEAWAVYGVAKMPLAVGSVQFQRLFGDNVGNTVVLEYRRGGVRYRDALRTYSATVANGVPTFHLYWARRFGAQLWLGCDNSTFGPFSPTSNVQWVQNTVGRLSAALPAGVAGEIAELRVYEGNVDDDQHQAIVDELLERYGL